MAEEGAEKLLPDMKLSQYRYLLTVPSFDGKEEVKKQLLDAVLENKMVKFYEELCAQFHWDVDNAWVQESNKTNEETLKQLDEKIEDAVKNLGETEVRESNLAKAEFLLKIGDKVAAESAYRVTTEKTVALGQRLDIVLTLIRIGFFYNDKDLALRNIEKGMSLIEEGGDWDRRNRLRVYKAYYLMSIRNFEESAKLFLATLPSFSAEELFDYKKNVFYTTLTSLFCLDRVTLKQKVVDAPEVLTVISTMPALENLLNNFYNSEYQQFFVALASITDQMKEDPALQEHVKYFSREMRIRAYVQFLESYRSVQLKSMANAFGVTEGYLDKELSRFIYLGRLNCRIDAVGGVVETIRPDTKNAQYHNAIKQGDLLLNRIQKLSRVIHL
eukprot:TRINITY_DN13106_c0_g1_i1.p1 TRINITY_DN13106_c0_g1~~TRINITY_DN13106_c0_g1_i1.p1  ORF type:complete len:396 (-),score=111.89 TRINITY_DN13106_c0_g1_i1:96-1253(-)